MAIKFMFERMALRWVLEHQFIFLKALLFVMMDLTGEVGQSRKLRCLFVSARLYEIRYVVCMLFLLFSYTPLQKNFHLRT